MYLSKFIYVNWGNIPHGEFSFGPTNLFSGGNGSGKTTAADAIQTVMTAAHDGLFHFNPGQDESTQRGRGGKQVRTLASYVLGCDDGAYARPESAFGYLAACFMPHPGEDAVPFTAMLAMSAYVEQSGKQRTARMDALDFYVLPEVALALSDLLKEDQGGRYVVPTDQLQKLLRKQYGEQRIEKYERKKAYLCRLYGALRGRTDAVSEREALNAARAFSRFMAYKPIRAIDEFVATEVLEPKDIGDAVKDVSSMLKRIHAMESDARKVAEAAARLQQARNSADSFIDLWLELQQLIYAVARRDYDLGQKKYLAEKARQGELNASLEQNRRDTDIARERLEILQQEINEVQLQRLQVPALRDREQLQRERDALEATIVRATVPLLQDAGAIRQAQTNARQLLALARTSDWEGFNSPAFTALAARVADKAAGEPADIHQLANRDWIDISPLESQLDRAQLLQQLHNDWAAAWLAKGGLQQQLQHTLDKQLAAVKQTERQFQTCNAEVAQLEARQVSYPAYVRTALEAIRRQLPEADARVLCDHVEVDDPAWQAAIEGYVGGARFGIIVDPAWEAEAIRLVRQLPGRDNRARIIQGSRARDDAERMTLDNDSILGVMSFSHDTARYYMQASYGQVLRVESAEALRQVRRGVTQDAIGAANYALFRCDIDDAELVFGVKARERALKARQAEAQQLARELQAQQERAGALQQLADLTEGLATNRYADGLQQLLAHQREHEALGARLARLDVSDFSELEQTALQLQASFDALRQSISELEELRIGLAAEHRTVTASCQKADQQQDEKLAQLESAEHRLAQVVSLWPDFRVDAALEQAEDWAGSRQVAQLTEQQAEIRTALGRLMRRLDSLVQEHNQQADMADGIVYEPDLANLESEANFSVICQLQRNLDGLYNRLRNNILAARQSEISGMRASFNNAFVTNLCHAIYQSVKEGEATLEQLNRELEHHRFGADRERFYFGYSWVPEFSEYRQFFRAVIENPSIGDGESLFDMPLEKKQLQVRDKLMAMLLDADEQRALKELARIADYRNYRRYEIYKEPEGKAPIALSQYGTGSGGQLETPAYIIRSAAITSAFRFNEGRSHLRMVLVDEAFSKMDEHRSKEVIQYLTETLGLQLMFIMPSSKSGPFMDLISNQFVFSKCATAQAIGELKSRVLVDRQVLNQTAVKALMNEHRATLRHQASLDFLDEVERLGSAD